MSELVTDCPRCKAQHVTFDVLQQNSLPTVPVRWGSAAAFEAFSVCRRCGKSTVFVLLARAEATNQLIGTVGGNIASLRVSLGNLFESRGYINQSNMGAKDPPEHLPPDLDEVFTEGAKCLAIGCFNAAGTMFRLCIDIATRSMLPAVGTEGGPNNKQRRDLGLRLPWLFENGLLPADLHDLASCIKDDGNDGAHTGNLTESDTEDLLDFTYSLLDRLYTEPARVKLALERRLARRQPPAK